MRLEEERHVKREMEVARLVAEKWKCTHNRIGGYSSFDIYFLREKTLVAVAEIKTRHRLAGSFETVLLNIDKWFPLRQWETGLGIPSFYVVAFTDGIYFTRIGTLNVRDFKLTCRGREDRPGIQNDVRPVIEIPLNRFGYLCSSEGVFEADNLEASA